MSEYAYEYGSDVLNEDDVDARKPAAYHVVLYNDEYTTMDFVVFILERIFHHNRAAAEKIMLDVHQKGKGVAGTYTRDIAETKVMQTRTLAREHNYPLKCVAEPA
ncbi:ATP-dependent Clp protease adapter ClpS [candidate division KSB3 bacterium]|uniref:ATP-dependent Clp protease adapter protein ClpS n=1 Tax=candidate division KSB3 bacterium TaxID=2044937 RepID=A0A2G6E3R5_9BACT|nr:MAG: ATP-dependent Clp protease adapter ClpS [candidate division KSB3 bacterium]PIE29400.1 MAG: ATP-dependent Clp protease adapter ClpS [candidate division KSB3 bacterium]